MKEKKNTLVRRMLIAIVLSFLLGFGLMHLRQALLAGGRETVWQTIYALLLADVTKEPGLGLFFVIQTAFMNMLKLVIAPMILTSLILAMGSVADVRKLGRIAYKTVLGFLGVYVAGCVVASLAARLCISTGLFTISSAIGGDTSDLMQLEAANPMALLVEMVPSNLMDAFSGKGSILAVVFVAVVCGLCLNRLEGERGKTFLALVEDVSEIIRVCVEFMVQKVGPVAIFAMISRAFALYGMEQMKSAAVFLICTILVLLLYLIFGYGLILFVTTRLNPLIFLRKVAKVGLFAFSTISSAATLPLNTRTNVKELGVREDVADFVLPMGMTINMNGTAIMQIMGTAFIATVAGYELGAADFVMMSLLAILVSAGAPAVPASGTVLLLTVVMGMGFSSELALATYALILAINRPVEMVLTSLNVVGDACTAVMVAHSEGELDEEIYYDRKKPE